MTPRNPQYPERVREIFDRAPFVQELGIALEQVTPGRCEARLETRAGQVQQTGVVHAGVIATLADHTAGGAAGSLVREDQIIVTADLHVSLLRPCPPGDLRCVAQVIKAGERLIVADVEVTAGPRLVAKALVTLVPVPWSSPG